MTEIDDITDEFAATDCCDDSFQCPKCKKYWGFYNYDGLDYYEERKVKCTCGAVLKVEAEAVTSFSYDVEVAGE